MSIHRRAARRDANEPTIRKAFWLHGRHTEQMSGAGMPDLLVWGGTRGGPLLVDVKMPDGKVTPAQEEKWKALREKGIPVYVVRTPEDVDALVRGELLPWRPWENEVRGMEREAKRGRRQALATVTADAGKRLSVVREPGSGTKRAPRKGDAAKARAAGALKVLEEAGYIPPRSRPVDAAKEAEAFAPALEEAATSCCSSAGLTGGQRHHPTCSWSDRR